MYKKSKYNVEVDILENGDILLYNTLSTAFGIMDKTTQELYENIDKYGVEDLERLKNHKGFVTLLKNQYIIPQEFDEMNILKFMSQKSRYAHRMLRLTIAPTLDCNMACPYCYEDRQNIYMDENVKLVIHEFVKNYLKTNGCNHFHVTWYGGEPLLEIDTIVTLSEKFKELTEELNINYTASIVTNGVLLNRENALIIRNECDIKSAQITIDGLPEYHNRSRILIAGRDSFDTIIHNIEKCKDLIDIQIRVNVDKNNQPNIEQLADYFINEKGWYNNPTFYLAPVEYYNNGCYLGENCLDSEEFARVDMDIFNRLFRINSEKYKKHLYPAARGNYCGAVESGTFVVDPKGDLYTCWHLVGKVENKIGNVIQKNPLNQEYLKWLTYEPAEKCLSCNILPICSGGCPHEFLQHKEPKCEKRLLYYKEKLKLAYNEYKKNKNATTGL